MLFFYVKQAPEPRKKYGPARKWPFENFFKQRKPSPAQDTRNRYAAYVARRDAPTERPVYDWEKDIAREMRKLEIGSNNH